MRDFPHRWLNEKKKGTKRLFEALGGCFEYVEKYAAILLRNSYTRTAVELLPLLEEEYGIKAAGDLSIRRAIIIAKKRTQDCPVTKPDLLSMLQALEITAFIEHFYNNYTIKVGIEENPMGIPVHTLLSLLDENIRGHVNFWLETRTDVTFQTYTASYVEICGTYNLKTVLADVNINGVIYTQNRMEICGSYYLATVVS